MSPTVQQGRLNPTDTTVDLSNFYNDAVATAVTDVNRIVHNGTQYVRFVIRRPQPTVATRGTTSGTLRTATPVYIDGSFVASTSSDINLITVGFDKLITTTTLRVFSTIAIDATAAKWAVRTSLNNLESEFNNSAFQAAISSVTQAIVSTVDGGNQFRYTIVVSSPPIDTTAAGLSYWRITHQTAGAFNNVTEVQVVSPLTPTLSYFGTNGSFSSSSTFEKSQILDATYSAQTNVFYTIRYNSDNVGTANVTLNDDFGDADAGTASGTSNFNPSRWDESNVNTQFLRTSDQLSYNVALGKGQLETTYTLANNINVQLAVTPTTLTSKQMWLSLRALNSNNNTIMSEGIGYDTSPTATGVWFSSRIASLVDAAGTSDLRELRPLWHKAQNGTDSFTIAYNGAEWTVNGSQTGALTNATTGVNYDATVEPNTPIEFVISSTAAPTTGHQFTFDLITVSGHKPPLQAGTLKLTRSGTNFTNNNTILSPVTVDNEPVSIEIFGHSDGSVNISADNFTVTGTSSFPAVAVFTVEKTNSTGLVTGSPLIESFDIIGDPNLTYNDFLDGRVMITATSTGTSGGHVYIKVNDTLYKYSNVAALGTETGSSAVQTSVGQIPKDGTNSFSWTRRSTVGGAPFLTYVEHDSTLGITRLKTIDSNTLQNTTTSRQTLLNVASDYATKRFKLFYNQNDFDTLYFVDNSTNLQSFNLDDRISAFMAVNANDVTLPAGTAQQTFVNAQVINAWGEVLAGKVVTFSVTAGDGAVTPSTDTTTVSGIATTQFTVGSSVGVSTITATVTET